MSSFPLTSPLFKASAVTSFSSIRFHDRRAHKRRLIPFPPGILLHYPRHAVRDATLNLRGVRCPRRVEISDERRGGVVGENRRRKSWEKGGRGALAGFFYSWGPSFRADSIRAAGRCLRSGCGFLCGRSDADRVREDATSEIRKRFWWRVKLRWHQQAGALRMLGWIHKRVSRDRALPTRQKGNVNWQFLGNSFAYSWAFLFSPLISKWPILVQIPL